MNALLYAFFILLVPTYLATIPSAAMQLPKNFFILNSDPQGIIGGMGLPTTSQEIAYLNGKNIGLIVTVHEAPLPASLFVNAPTIKRIHFNVKPGTMPDLDAVYDFINEARKTHRHGKGVIVHCQHGNNRTGAMLACWLVANKNMAPEHALAYLLSKRIRGSISKQQKSFVQQFYHSWQNNTITHECRLHSAIKESHG